MMRLNCLFSGRQLRVSVSLYLMSPVALDVCYCHFCERGLTLMAVIFQEICCAIVGRRQLVKAITLTCTSNRCMPSTFSADTRQFIYAARLDYRGAAKATWKHCDAVICTWRMAARFC